VRRLDRHIGCACRPIERKQAQADAGKYGSAAAGHVDNSSARIPASLSLFLHSCRRAALDAIHPPALLQVIRNWQERTWTMQLNRIV
jgi:hypothetical protein